MCTAMTFNASSAFFGRNLDNDTVYNESVTITPRKYPFFFREKGYIHEHFAMIGMATVEDQYPLYYDATNEAGLSMAGLNFPDHAVYFDRSCTADNIASFELIPWILCQCANTKQALEKINSLNITNDAYSSKYPITPLHWFIADNKTAYTIESTKNGINIYNNPLGVLTNNPPFEYHMYNVINYLNLTNEEPVNRFAPTLSFRPYSLGMGAMGLPGDLSSSSRFVKATFTKFHSVQPHSDSESIRQFFHILTSVAQQEGCVKIGNRYEKTIYTSCCDTNKGTYYYSTYENPQITGVSMQNVDLNTKKLISYTIKKAMQVCMDN